MSPSELAFSLRNDRGEIARMFSLLEPFCRAHGISDDDVFNIRLVLDEAVINVIVHGYDDTDDHVIDVSLQLTGGTLHIHIVDDGVPYNPLEAPSPRFDVPIEQRRIGGLGVHIMKSLAREVRYRRENNRNHLDIDMAVNRKAECSPD